MARDETALVQLQVRMREDLRRSLADAALARMIPLNTVIVERLAYTRDRANLLSEVLRIAYGDRIAGVLMVLGPLMRLAGTTKKDADWMADADVYERVEKAVMAAFEYLGPGKGPPTAKEAEDEPSMLAWEVLIGLVSPVVPDYMESRADLEAVRTMLAPVVERWRLAALPVPDEPAERQASEAKPLKKLRGPVAPRVTPIYLQVRDALVERIASGEWKPRSAIPNEGHLAREFGVSSATIRKALELMEAKGLITRLPTVQKGEATLRVA